MSEKKNFDLFPDFDQLEAAYSDSLKKLDRIGAGSAPEDTEQEPVPEENHPTDAADYRDPGENNKQIYDKMVDELERRRSRKSIWSDEPVVPVRKSIWLDDGKEKEKTKPEPERPPQPEKPKRPAGRENMETIELKISPEVQERMRAAKEKQRREAATLEAERQKAEAARAEAARIEAEERAEAERLEKERKARKERAERVARAANAPVITQAAAAAGTAKTAAEGEQSSRTRQRPEGEQSSRTRQRPEGEQSSRTRQRPEGEQSSRTRQRPEGEQSSRTRQRPEGEQSSRTRQSPEGEQSSRTRQRPEGEQSSRTRQRPDGQAAPKKRSSASGAHSRTRKRKKPKIKEYELEFSFINAVLCLLLVFGTGIALLVMKRESGVIESEKRYYAEKPKFTLSSYFKGEYTADLVTYYTDTVPNREGLKSFSDWFSNHLGIHNGIQIRGDLKAVKQETVDEDKKATTTTVGLVTNPAPEATEPGESKPTETTTTKATTTKVKKVVADEADWAGNVIITGKGKDVRAMPAFYGQFSTGEKYANVINKYKEALGDSVNVFNMDIPLASAYYLPEDWASQLSDQHECIENIGLHLKGVINVDVYDTLDDHAGEYIYSRTDHHWQPLGAYYATQVFAEKANVPYPDLSTYTVDVKEDFLGTMYTFSDYYQELANYPDTFTYYIPDNYDNVTTTYYDTSFSNGQEGPLFFDFMQGGACYSTFLGSDDRITEIETDCDNGRVLVIMKDSYGNALAPFLTHSFSKIYVLDFRYLNISAVEFMKNVGATDVLFAVSISGGHTESHIDSIEEDLY